MVPSEFCPHCGTILALDHPDLELIKRPTCTACGFVKYDNPKTIVGCHVWYRDKLLMVRRAIEPSRGLWTPPAGFLESGESLETAAAREVWEEAGVAIAGKTLFPYVATSLIDLKQVYFLFRTTVDDCRCAPGVESLAAGFFGHAEMPWSALAFPGMKRYLEFAFEERKNGAFNMHVGTIKEGTFKRSSFLLSHLVSVDSGPVL